MADFVGAIREGREPLSSKKLGLDVVRLIEAAELSLEYNGSPQWLDNMADDPAAVVTVGAAAAACPFCRGTGLVQNLRVGIDAVLPCRAWSPRCRSPLTRR